MEKAGIKDRAVLVASLARTLGLPASEIGRRLAAPGRFAWIRRDAGEPEAAKLAEAKLPGVGVLLGQRRIYPNGELAAGVLGRVGAEQRGLSGAESAFELRLRGQPRRLRLMRDGAGGAIHQDSEPAPQRPEPLRLAIDRDVQFHAEEALREASSQFRAKGGMILVQDPATGEILAMASAPSDPLRNPAIQDTYEPGSTFKLVGAAAALNESLVSESETFFCENGTYALAPGVFIHDHEPEASLTLQGILERSSNIGMAKVVERLGAMRFYRYSRAFGFDIRTGIALPGETAGSMKPLTELTRVALAASSYGYGIGASALQVANAYSAVANGGTLYEPAVICDEDARPDAACRRPVRVRRVLGQAAAAALTRMLEGVVERGTGIPARVPGYRIAGKTGTARKLEPGTGRYSTSAYMASFVGFLPLSRPRWTILVVIDEPKGQYYGAQVAAPVFAKLARRLLTLAAVPPDREPGALAAAPTSAPRR
ncbi:MAG: penicillin-binding protein 2 [Elusimicrobia bacterium]|nr:penicillin-binding protein 2 [Elusimicrobiota bacterium]